jgi:hypothetical protein
MCVLCAVLKDLTIRDDCPGWRWFSTLAAGRITQTNRAPRYLTHPGTPMAPAWPH